MTSWLQEEILTAFITGGALATLLQLYFSARRERTKEGQTNRLLALKMSSEIERYVYRAQLTLDSHENYISSAGGLGKAKAALEASPVVPEGDYQFFDPELLERVMNFSLDQDYVIEYARFVFDVGDGEDYSDALYIGEIELSYRALQLADEIRAAYGLRPRAFQYGSFDARASLQDKREKVWEKARAKGREDNLWILQ